jgi:hypothetical protein
VSEIVPVLLGQVNSERALSVFQNHDYAGKPLTASDYEALVRSTYGASADAVLAEYPLDSFDSPGIAWTTMQNDSTSYTREVLFGQLSRQVPKFAYEFAEKDTPQWPRYRQNTGEIMSLSSCDTSPATARHQRPASRRPTSSARSATRRSGQTSHPDAPAGHAARRARQVSR